MKEPHHIQLEFEKFENADLLPEQWQVLLEKAKEVSTSAYAPYSDYQVGAALLLDNDEVITGNNQENAAYPSGLCAERVAFFSASTQYPESVIKKVVVVAKKKSNTEFHAAAPCGACRQVMLEYEIRQEQPIELLMVFKEGSLLISSSIANMLPISFNRSNLL